MNTFAQIMGWLCIAALGVTLAASTESLSGGNPGETSASRRADHRGIASAGSADEESTGIARAAQSESHRGAEQLSADSAERRSPVARDSATPDEGNRQQAAALAEGADGPREERPSGGEGT